MQSNRRWEYRTEEQNPAGKSQCTFDIVDERTERQQGVKTDSVFDSVCCKRQEVTAFFFLSLHES